MIIQHRATLVFINDQKILLMYRFKNGGEYYVFPGGGVEDGESVEIAAIREAKEETGLDVVIEKKLWEYENRGRIEHFFLVRQFEGVMKIGGPEEDRQSADNIYKLKWMPLEKVQDIKLLPETMKEKVLEEFLK